MSELYYTSYLYDTIKEQITNKIFHVSTKEAGDLCTVTLTFSSMYYGEDGSPSFEELEKISNLLKTKKMSSKFFAEFGGCPTCGIDEHGQIWHCYEVAWETIYDIANKKIGEK